jgi:hypothetical protein
MIIIDNFLEEPDRIREEALELTFTKAEPNSPGWKGFRCLYTTMPGEELNELLRDKLNELDLKFNDSQLRCHFHYTVNEDMSNTIHTDGIFDYAGVLYLTPNPPLNSGTVFYDDNNEQIDYVENVYNRLTIYPANIRHSIKESFGDNINNGRLVYTVFLTLTKQNYWI